jgi:hypothetical protein
LFVFILTSQLSARVWIPVVYDGLSPIVDIPTLSIMCGLERDTPIPIMVLTLRYGQLVGMAGKKGKTRERSKIRFLSS